MHPRRSSQNLQPALETMVDALEQGSWRTVLYGARAADLARGSAGSRGLTAAVLLRQLAASMQAQACGRPDHSWALLQDAVRMLPSRLVDVDASTAELRAGRPLTPGTAGLPALITRISTVAWREQTELAELRERFAPARTRAREVLVEAAVQFLIWVEFDHAGVYGRDADPDLVDNDPTTVDRDRRTLLRRATLLRQFADPATGDVTPPVWQDIGKWRGLRAAANHALASRRDVSCCADPAVPVRMARMEAWQAARRWLDSREC